MHFGLTPLSKLLLVSLFACICAAASNLTPQNGLSGSLRREGVASGPTPSHVGGPSPLPKGKEIDKTQNKVDRHSSIVPGTSHAHDIGIRSSPTHAHGNEQISNSMSADEHEKKAMYHRILKYGTGAYTSCAIVAGMGCGAVWSAIGHRDDSPALLYGGAAFSGASFGIGSTFGAVFHQRHSKAEQFHRQEAARLRETGQV